MKKIIILILVLANIHSNGFANGKSRKEINGDKYFFVYSFDKAIDSYTHAKNLSVEGQRRLAESYHNMNQDVKSENEYAKLITSTDGVLANDYFNYAMVLKNDGKIEESNSTMDKFQSLYPNDLRAKDYEANKNEFAAWSKDNGKYTINHLNFNTDAEDFGPSYYKDEIVFASSRTTKMAPREYNWNGKPFLDMYVSQVDQNELKAPSVFDKSLDGKMHDGPASFNKDGTFMAFTRNNYDTKRKDRVVGLQICFSTFTNGKWSKPVPFILDSATYSVGQPCLSADGNTMYFASNMPGGFGGSDIYRISRDEKGVWGKPENLGNKINTEGDEMFPYVEQNNGVLFFSSNGHFGLGGLDIFLCTINGSDFGAVHNAGAPLNTAADDFGVIVNDSMRTGYFSSNRVGGSGDDDIYSFDIINGFDIGKKIVGIAKDKNGNAIPNAFVTLLDDQGKTIDTVTTKTDGAYAFFVDANKNFKLVGKKINYLDGENNVNTSGKNFIVKADVTLLQKETVAEVINVNDDLGKIAALKTIYFDLDKYNIRPDAATELDKIVAEMNAHPEMVVELKSYCDCRDTKEYNQILSDKRAQASADYIKKRITNPSRISGKGYGKTNLLNSCDCDGDAAAVCTEAQQQVNRRTEFIIIKK